MMLAPLTLIPLIPSPLVIFPSLDLVSLSLTSQPGRDNHTIHSSLSAREKWFLSKYPFRGAQVWTEPYGPGLERKISINIGHSVTSNHGAVTAGWAGVEANC